MALIRFFCCKKSDSVILVRYWCAVYAQIVKLSRQKKTINKLQSTCSAVQQQMSICVPEDKSPNHTLFSFIRRNLPTLFLKQTNTSGECIIPDDEKD